MTRAFRINQTTSTKELDKTIMRYRKILVNLPAQSPKRAEALIDLGNAIF